MTVTGTIEECEKRIQEYQGVSDELILARTGRQGDTGTLADCKDLFYLIDQATN